MKYSNYHYIYPPRPKNTINPKDLGDIDNGLLLAQLKFNGSNTTIYTNGEKIIVMNRHNQRLTNFRIDDSEIISLYKGTGWMALNCEYLNKSKLDENGKPFNHKLIIFDVLVWDGEYLIGKTFAERVQLLDDIFGKNPSEKEYLWKISDNIYRAKTYLNDFSDLYDRYHKIDLIEGLVMKRRSAKLEIGNTENNNSKSQVKCRKETKNYKF